MNKSSGNKKIINKRTVFVLLTILFSLAIFLLNRIHPLWVDDWIFSFVYNDKFINWDDATTKRIGSFHDILISQYNLYFRWVGRVITHGIAQFLLFIPPLLKQILNTLAYTAFVLLIYYICNGNLKKNIRLYLYTGIFLLLFISLPVFNQTVLWTTGSANYLWGTSILLLFILFYYKHYISETSPQSITFSVLFLLFGIVSGWTNENSVATVLLFLFIYLIYLKRSKKNIPQWMILGFIGLCIGATFLVLAPGNFARANTAPNIIAPPILEIVIQHIKNVVYVCRTVYAIPVLSVIFLFLLFFQFRKKKELLNSKEGTAALFFFLMGYFSISIMLLVPYFPSRASFFSVVMLIISVGILWRNLSFERMKIFNSIVLVFLLTIFISKYSFMHSHILNFHNIMNERQQIIEEEKKKGNFDIILHNRIHFPKEFDYIDISPDTSNYINKTHLNYFEIKSIRLIDLE